jgi:multiple sugar transport system permease protein
MEKTDRYGYLFILPFFVVFAIFYFYPIVSTFITSLTDESMTSFEVNFVGFRNYVNELSTPLFWKSFLNTWIIWLPNIILQLGLALLIAVVLTNIQLRIKFVGAFRAIFFFPNLVTVASIAILAYAILDWQNGILNQLVFGTGEGAQDKYIFWINNPHRARFILSIILTWQWFGYTMILFMAGMISIPRTLYEAAYVDGASGWRTFRSITLPLLTPVMIYIVITSLIGGMNIFDLPWIMTQGSGGPNQSMMTTVVYMYNRAFPWYQIGSGSAVAYILFIFTAIFSVIYLRIITRGREVG